MRTKFCCLVILLFFGVGASAGDYDAPEYLRSVIFKPAKWSGINEIIQTSGDAIFAKLKAHSGWPGPEPSPEVVLNFLSQENAGLAQWEISFARGLLLATAGDSENATRNFQETVSLKSDYFPGWVALGKVLTSEEPLVFFQKAVEKAPQMVEGYDILAQLHVGDGYNIKAAIEVYEEAIEKIPEPPDHVYYNQCALIFRSGDYRPYLEQFYRSVKILLEQGRGPVHLALGGIFSIYTEEYEKGLEFFSEALSIEPEYVMALYGAAECNHLLGRNGKALEYAKRIPPLIGGGKEKGWLEKRLDIYRENSD